MPSPLVLLFYAWLLISIVVLISRLVGRGKAAKTPRAPRGPISAMPATPTAPPVPPPPSGPAGPPSSADAVINPGAADRPAPGSVWRPPAKPAAVAGRSAAGSASVIDALTGIQLPCDLMPLTTVEGRSLTEREVLLMTATHDPEDVIAAVGDELERLGYRVVTMGGDKSAADRGSDHLRITVHRHPEALLIGTRQVFPTASPGSVVVELSV